jgi:lipopolysaccharide export system permease protein
MMRTMDRYVAREFMRLFLLFALAAPILFIIGDWTDNINHYSDRGLTLDRIALGYLYRLPLFISWSFPVAALVATVFTVNNMSRHSEMAAAKAGGISFYRVLAVLPILGIALTIAGMIVQELVPIGEGKRKVVMGEVEETSDAMRHEFVYSSPSGQVFTVRRLGIQPRGQIGGLAIDQRKDGVHTYVTATDAYYDSTGIWRLENGYVRRFAGDTGPETAYHFRQMHIQSFRETPDQLMARPKEPEEMRYGELGTYITTLERSGVGVDKLKVERAGKIAIPFATLVIVLFGAPLATTSHRGGPAYGIGISLGVTILYMLLFKVTGAAGEAGALDPLPAAWIPNGLFFVAALLLLTRVRT